MADSNQGSDGAKYKVGGGAWCAVHGCTNNRRKLNIWKISNCQIHGTLHVDCPCLIPFSLHRMPNDQVRRLEWARALNRKDLPANIFVCSKHFLDGRPTPRNPYPKLHLGYANKITTGRPEPRKRLFQTPVAGDKNGKEGELPATLEIEDTCDIDSFVGTNVCKSTATLNESPFIPTVVSEGTQWNESDFTCNDHSYSKPWTNIFDACTQTTDVVFKDKGEQCNIQDGTLSANDIKTDSDAFLYTGVSKEVFLKLVSTMSQFYTFSYQLAIADQILLCLMRLRPNLIYADLSRRFGISVSLACKIVNSWIPLLSEKLSNLVVWLPRETIRACCPDSFRENYPHTTCIIDCAETFIQRPTNLKSRSETYSNYKSHNTVKYLVGISPHGQIMFISHAFGGRASDKFIVENSGFLQYLLPGDEIMADRGITIEDLLFDCRVKLNIPSFTKGKPQLSNKDVTTTRRIASVRIHIERAIRRMKVFKILSSIVPVSALNLFDDILIICAALTNLRGDLIRECGSQ